MKHGFGYVTKHEIGNGYDKPESTIYSSYKQAVVKSEFSVSHVLDRCRSTFFSIDKIEIANLRVCFLDSMKLGIGFLIVFGDFNLI